MSEPLQFGSNMQHLLPYLVVTVGVLLTSIWNLFFPKHKGWTAWIAVVALSAGAGLLLRQADAVASAASGSLYLFYNLLTIDSLSLVIGVLACLMGTIVVFMTMGYEHKFGANVGEYYAILLAAVLSVMFLACATDLIMLFVALETLTLCCVLMSGFAKRDIKSNEAALKYLLSTAATTATLMYGLSFLYGLTGSTDIYQIQRGLFQYAQTPHLVIVLLIMLMVSVIGFKLSIVPFHMWTPDVYEGAPIPTTAFLSTVSKLGGAVVALRLFSIAFVSLNSLWIPVLAALAIVSMIAGNTIALAQKSLKRMLAYSSIAHVGYLLLGLVANNEAGISGAIFYLIVYSFMNLGAFTIASIIENETGSDLIDDYAGLIRKRPFLTVCMAICLFNLGGLPIPPAGFLAKIFVFWPAAQLYSITGVWLIAIALITSIPAVYYYTRVAIKMIVAEPGQLVSALPEKRLSLPSSQMGPAFAVTIALVGIFMCSFNVMPIMDWSKTAMQAVESHRQTASNDTFDDVYH